MSHLTNTKLFRTQFNPGAYKGIKLKDFFPGFGGSPQPGKKELLPFQSENVATNQQNIPLPYLGGERVMAVRWISAAIDQITHQAATGKKG